MLIKYGIYLFFIVFAIGISHSFLKKLKNEPATLAKLIFVTITPPALAISLPFYILSEELEFPMWACIIAGFAIYALATNFLEKNVKVKFMDED